MKFPSSMVLSMPFSLQLSEMSKGMGMTFKLDCHGYQNE